MKAGIRGGNYLRNPTEIKDVVKDLRSLYIMDFPLNDTGDVEDAAFYGLRGDCEENKERMENEIDNEMKGRGEVIGTATEDTEEWGGSANEIRNIEGRLRKGDNFTYVFLKDSRKIRRSG